MKNVLSGLIAFGLAISFGAPSMAADDGTTMAKGAKLLNDAKKKVEKLAKRIKRKISGTDAKSGQTYATQELGAHYAENERDHNIRATAKVGGQSFETRAKDMGQTGASTIYMNEKQTKQHKVGFSQTDGPEGKNAALTQKGKAIDGKRIFVMDSKGKIYAADDKIHGKEQVKDSAGNVADIHHSSLLAGKRVAGAGEITTNASGIVKAVSDRSGHYKPGDIHTNQVLQRLEKKGVTLDNVHFFSAGSGANGMAKEFQQGGTTEQFAKRHNLLDEMKGEQRFKRVDDSKRSRGAKMFAKAREAADSSPDNGKQVATSKQVSTRSRATHATRAKPPPVLGRK